VCGFNIIHPFQTSNCASSGHPSHQQGRSVGGSAPPPSPNCPVEPPPAATSPAGAAGHRPKGGGTVKGDPRTPISAPPPENLTRPKYNDGLLVQNNVKIPPSTWPTSPPPSHLLRKRLLAPATGLVRRDGSEPQVRSKRGTHRAAEPGDEVPGLGSIPRLRKVGARTRGKKKPPFVTPIYCNKSLIVKKSHHPPHGAQKYAPGIKQFHLLFLPPVVMTPQPTTPSLGPTTNPGPANSL